MSTRHPTSRPAFTLLELVAAMVVLSIIASVLMPVIVTASEQYTTTRSVRTQTEQLSFALDRVARVIRQAPIGDGDSGVGITSASASGVTFSDGTGFELVSDQLELLVPGSSNALLCSNIDSIQIDYLDDDGQTSTVSTPTQTHRIAVTLRSGDLEMSILAHPRIWIGQVSP